MGRRAKEVITKAEDQILLDRLQALCDQDRGYTETKNLLKELKKNGIQDNAVSIIKLNSQLTQIREAYLRKLSRVSDEDVKASPTTIAQVNNTPVFDLEEIMKEEPKKPKPICKTCKGKDKFCLDCMDLE